MSQKEKMYFTLNFHPIGKHKTFMIYLVHSVLFMWVGLMKDPHLLLYKTWIMLKKVNPLIYA